MSARELSRLHALGLLVVASACVWQPSVARAQQTITLGGREVVVWSPPSAAGRQPVLIFSHGFGGCAVQSKFLTEALAAHGYWVIAPNHKDARCGGARSGRSRPDTPFREPEQWSDQSFVN